MEALRISITNKIHKIVLDSPRSKNAISLKMYEGITKALNSTSDNESVLATVITGSGDFYSSGNDIKGYMVDGFDFEKQSQEAASILEKFVASFVNHSKILIAVVNGPAIGIAATTLALCDYVVASDKAYFYTPFTSLGLSPEGCSTFTFPRLLGTRKVFQDVERAFRTTGLNLKLMPITLVELDFPSIESRATQMLLFNYKLSAQEALQHGFVNKVMPHSNINDAWAHIDQLLEVSHESLLSAKKLLRDRDRDVLLKANAAECEALVERWKSEDFIQQLMNFLNKKAKL